MIRIRPNLSRPENRYCGKAAFADCERSSPPIEVGVLVDPGLPQPIYRERGLGDTTSPIRLASPIFFTGGTGPLDEDPKTSMGGSVKRVLQFPFSFPCSLAAIGSGGTASGRDAAGNRVA